MSDQRDSVTYAALDDMYGYCCGFISKSQGKDNDPNQSMSWGRGWSDACMVQAGHTIEVSVTDGGVKGVHHHDN